MSDIQRAIITELLKTRISNAFENWLEKNINIAKGIRGDASVSQNHLREYIASKNSTDYSFPKILANEDSDFLGGSFDRHTKIWPLDDIDIYFPLDGFDLYYTSQGQHLPYTVVSDKTISANPVLNSKWCDESNGVKYISSVKLISGFATALQSHYPQATKIKANQQAITIQMKKGETENSDGLGFDVVPCFLLLPHNPSEMQFYLMPDGKNGWIRTNPKIDASITQNLHNDNNKTFRKVVKLIKFWNKEFLSGTFNSFFIELSVAKEYERRNNSSQFLNSISQGLAVGFRAVYNSVKAGSLNSWLPNAPLVFPGIFKATDLEHLNNIATCAQVAVYNESLGQIDAAMKTWRILFGDTFGE